MGSLILSKTLRSAVRDPHGRGKSPHPGANRNEIFLEDAQQLAREGACGDGTKNRTPGRSTEDGLAVHRSFGQGQATSRQERFASSCFQQPHLPKDYTCQLCGFQNRWVCSANTHTLPAAPPSGRISRLCPLTRRIWVVFRARVHPKPKNPTAPCCRAEMKLPHEGEK